MQTIASLRQAMARASLLPVQAQRVGTGVDAVDAVLGGGLARGALHDIYAETEADMAAASGFALGLAIRFAGKAPLLWVRDDATEREGGGLYSPGLAAFGLDPDQLLLMRARNCEAALRAAGEAVRCASLGAVLMSLWGEPRVYGLTASRRLLLAAEKARVPLLTIRASASPAPGAAATRWAARALPSRALEANAPGFPRFAATLQRQRGGASGFVWSLEWDHEQRRFADDRGEPAATALSRPVVSFPAGAGDAGGVAAAGPFRRTG